MNSNLESEDSITPTAICLQKNTGFVDRRSNINILLKTCLNKPVLSTIYSEDKKKNGKDNTKIKAKKEARDDAVEDQEIRQDPDDPNKWEIFQVTPMIIEYDTDTILPKKKVCRTPCTCPYCKEGGKYTKTGTGKKKIHICEICKHTYGKSSHLNAHLMKHSGTKPFPCSLCDKRFTRSDEIRRHMRIHTGEKAHKCGQCGKEFTRSDHLSKHVDVHIRQRAKCEMTLEPSQYVEIHTDDMTSKFSNEESNETEDSCFLINNVKEEIVIEEPVILNIQDS